ncbi:MAG TPA: hypothetical protein VGH98_10415 [Gemmatimonadaceae bacterium]|jgi:hypothetical protein
MNDELQEIGPRVVAGDVALRASSRDGESGDSWLAADAASGAAAHAT